MESNKSDGPNQLKNTQEEIDKIMSVDGEFPTPEKREATILQKRLALVAAILLTVGIAVGIVLNNLPKKQEEQTPSSTSDSLKPGSSSNDLLSEISSSTAFEVLPTVESLEISYSVLSDPNTLAKILIDERFTSWVNAGATPENAKAAFEDGVEVNTYAEQEAAKFDNIYTDALLVGDWKSSPDLLIWIKRMETIHINTLQSYYKTYGHYYVEDKEAYFRGSKYTKIKTFTINSDGSIKTEITVHDYDNSDKNRGVLLNAGNKNELMNVDLVATFTFVNDNGKIKVSDMVS